MVQINFQSHNYIDNNFNFNINNYINSLEKHHENILKAILFIKSKDNIVKEDSPLLIGIQIAQISIQLNLDEDSILASLLYRIVCENKATLEEIEKKFNKDISYLIKGVLSLAKLSDSISQVNQLDDKSHTEIARKMLISILDDLRIILIKIAERTYAIRYLHNASEDRKKKISHQISEIYAPIAHRLGIGQIKWELEDLAFRYKHQDIYKQIAKLLSEKRIAREVFIDQVIFNLNQILKEEQIEAEITGRVKHIYSIWKKMQKKNYSFEQIYDIRAIRIIVPTIRDCYGVLGVIHSNFKHIPKEFDDYIANPKENGYQSLHTIVLDNDGKIFEIQIRTEKMHKEAELGICAHHLYKGTDTNKNNTKNYENKITWLRGLLEARKSNENDILSESFNFHTEQNRVYVFTPHGKAIDLQKGSTPIDFAYHIHTDIGNKTVGAKVNGKIVPLTYQLKFGDRVEILTKSNSEPSYDWLNQDLGFINTAKARSKIAIFFRQRDRDKNIIAGKNIIEKELNKIAIKITTEDVLIKTKYQSLDEMYWAAGIGDLKSSHLISIFENFIKKDEIKIKKNQTLMKQYSCVSSNGIDNLFTHLAFCCNPIPGDTISGFITKNKGISIHKDSCDNFIHLAKIEPKKIIEVSWGNLSNRYPVKLKINFYDRSGILKDVAEITENEKVNITSVNAKTNKKEDYSTLIITIEVSSLKKLSKIINRINNINNILDVKRIQ